MATPARCFITDDGYLISNYHVVKDATKVRLLTGAGLIDAKVVQVDAANDLALLKADRRGRFGRAGSPLPAVRPNAKNGAHGVTRPTGYGGGAGGERGVAGGPCGRPPIELRGQEQPAVELPGVCPRPGTEIEGAKNEGREV